MNRGRWLLPAVLVLSACGGTAAPTPAPASQRPTATPEIVEPTPEPVVLPAPGQAALGEIVFGTDFDADAFAVTGQTSRFKRTYPLIAYHASLTEAPGGGVLRITVTRQQGAGEETVIDEDVTVANPDFDSFGNAVDFASILGNVAGTYVMRFVLDGTVVAEGQFQLVK